MKKLLFAVIALMSLSMGYAQFSERLFPSIAEFQEEMKLRQRELSSNKHLGTNEIKPIFAEPRLVNGKSMIDAFIEIENKAVIDRLRQNGIIVNCEFDGFVTAMIPMDRLSMISTIPGVIDVEISKMLDFCTDSTLRLTRAGEVLNGIDAGLPQAYDGSGVIIGIIDAGFDYQHEAFRTEDKSRSRIVRVYDSENETGHTAIAGNETLPGSVFMGEQIDTLTTDCEGTHGTHTASIAAGTHAHGYGGMAPGADIVLCAARSTRYGMQDTEIARCIRYIYAYADSVNKPCVISLSVSTSYGAHDGRDRLSRVIEQSTGPGRIFVIAAGNNAAWPYSVYGLASEEQPINILIDCPHYMADDNYYYNFIKVDSWVRNVYTKAGMRFHILDKYTNRIVWESDPVTILSTFRPNLYSDYYEPDPEVNEGVGYMSAEVSADPFSQKYNTSITISNLKCKSYYIDWQGIKVSRYRIGVSLYPRKTTDSYYIDSWMATGSGVFRPNGQAVFLDSITDDGDTVMVACENFYTAPSSEISINSNAVNDSVISAGNYVGKTSFFSLNEDSVRIDHGVILNAMFYNSSYQTEGCGPSGKALPTITAPGTHVVAAGSRYSYFETNAIHPDLVLRTDEGYLWGAMTGTSMAAPTVAGIIAQWLQYAPDLSISEIKHIIAETAIKDQYTASPQFGPNGKIDALAGIRYLIINRPIIKMGDVNGDGEVTIRDVSLLIDFLLYDGDVSPFVREAADLNMDGDISIKDISTLIDNLLGIE